MLDFEAPRKEKKDQPLDWFPTSRIIFELNDISHDFATEDTPVGVLRNPPDCPLPRN